MRRLAGYWAKFRLIRRAIQQRNEFGMQRALDSVDHVGAGRIEVVSSPQALDQFLKQALRVVAIPKENAINPIEPLLSSPIDNRSQHADQAVNPAPRPDYYGERLV